MILNMLSIGLGLFNPIGELSSICPVGKEMGMSYEWHSLYLLTKPASIPIISGNIISFRKDKFEIDIFKLTQGAKIKIYKRNFVIFGIGGYYIRENLNKGFESESGLCYCFGFYIPLLYNENIVLAQETSYSTVPNGISLKLSVGINL
ncbi:MAG: hypothetical protein QMD71_08350 [bacterium]|nr:hypothetical protein [bacterium]